MPLPAPAATAGLPPVTRPPLLRLVPPWQPHASEQSPLPLEGGEPTIIHDPGVAGDVERVAVSLTRALTEVLAGRRPAGQIRHVLTPRVGLLVDHLIRSGRARDLRLAGVRVQAPTDAAIEVAARLVGAGRGSALALRAERRGTRWGVVALEAALASDTRHPARW